MKKNIHFFSRNEYDSVDKVKDKVGIRGKQSIEFASIDLPILPGFIIDSEVAAHLHERDDIEKHVRPFMKKCEEATGKIFGNPENPLLVKIVVSPNLEIVHYPVLHNFGLTEDTLPGFIKFVGEDFGNHEILFLIRGFLEIEAKVAELEGQNKAAEDVRKKIDQLIAAMDKDEKAPYYRKIFEKYRSLLPDDFFSDAYTQLSCVLSRISYMLSMDELDEEDTALIVQPMVYGNYGKNSASGVFFTRNIVTGEKNLQGTFNRNEFNTLRTEGQDITSIGKPFLKELETVAHTVEDHFKEIRSIRFTIEAGKVWLIDQRPVMTKSTQSDIQTLLDLYKRKIVNDHYIIHAVKPGQLNEILHPVINLDSVKKLKSLTGGISGAPGAAIGRVYFSTDRLLEAYKNAQQLGEDTRCILCLPASYANDVKAIEVATGVMSSEGGYSAHASVVARQYGKVSLVKPDMVFKGKKAAIGGVTIQEGDYISLNVPHFGEPLIYLGTAELIEPDPETSGLLEFIDIVKKNLGDFQVRVNADKGRDAELAVRFGASGIGLCRTEHMFFAKERINVFREMILADSVSEREKVLKKLKVMQKKDFYDLFKAMAGKEVTIRLLDAPLHEFLPHNQDEMKAFMTHLKGKKGAPTEKEVRSRCDALREFNPMLGHRGCRIAISYPEIYAMQIESIFEAAYKLKSEKVDVHPEIMIPLIMNEAELKIIAYGKRIEGYHYKGLIDIEREVRSSLKARPLEYKIGTMIELPTAALSAGEIARYAQFFSFGTNDLTQTTLGLSRDDYNSFMPDYTLFDIMKGNPFQLLNDSVKELVSTAVRRGTMTRPGLVKGLCGEHGAVPENIEFCMNAGLDYVSCSVYSVPIAILAAAQIATGDEPPL